VLRDVLPESSLVVDMVAVVSLLLFLDLAHPHVQFDFVQQPAVPALPKYVFQLRTSDAVRSLKLVYLSPTCLIIIHFNGSILESNNITSFPVGVFTSAFQETLEYPWIPYVVDTFRFQPFDVMNPLL
jgi:hypothetical protein